MKFKAIIFDMDGTIIDTDHIWKKATLTLIQSRGIILNDQEQKDLDNRLRGMAMPKACALIKDTFSLSDDLQALIQEKSAQALALYRHHVTFIPGFTDFHQLTQQHTLKTGVATNADDATVAVTKQSLALDTFFGSHIYGISCVNFVCKPDPAIYLHAAQQLNVDPQYCIAIEDSAHGIAAAKKAGMFCIGINTGQCKDNLKESHLIVDGYHQIELDSLLQKK